MRAALLCISACVAAIVVTVSGDAQTAAVDRADIAERAKKADRIVVATVEGVEGMFDTNEFGDQLIFSIASLRIDETLKGPAQRALTVRVEGGTVGDLTLEVADLPTMQPGDRAVFFLDSTASSTFVPHDRGHGIMKLDPDDRVQDTATTLDEVRGSVHAAVR